MSRQKTRISQLGPCRIGAYYGRMIMFLDIILRFPAAFYDLYYRHLGLIDDRCDSIATTTISSVIARRQDERGQSGRYRALYVGAVSGRRHAAADYTALSLARGRLRCGARRRQPRRTDDSRTRQQRQQRQPLVRENHAGERTPTAIR